MIISNYCGTAIENMGRVARSMKVLGSSKAQIAVATGLSGRGDRVTLTVIGILFSGLKEGKIYLSE